MIFYALISRGKTVLTEFTHRSGNFPTVSRLLLDRIDTTSDNKMSIVYDKHVFHYVVEDGITFLCLADEDEKRRIPFAFLEDIKQRFQEAYADRARTAIAFAMNQEFQHVLQRRMEYFNDNPESDRFAKVQSQIADTRDVMVKTIEKVLARGERIELLVDKTDQLNQSAFKFQKQSKALKNVMCWKNAKLMMLLTFLVIVVIWFIFSLICGFNFHCLKK